MAPLVVQVEDPDSVPMLQVMVGSLPFEIVSAPALQAPPLMAVQVTGHAADKGHTSKQMCRTACRRARTALCSDFQSQHKAPAVQNGGGQGQGAHLRRTAVLWRRSLHRWTPPTACRWCM